MNFRQTTVVVLLHTSVDSRSGDVPDRGVFGNKTGLKNFQFISIVGILDGCD